MIKLSKEKVMLLHEMLAKQTGGSTGIRDTDLLESALESAYQTFGGVELYPSVEEKGAWLGYALISNHAFVDGNKRIGMLCEHRAEPFHLLGPYVQHRADPAGGGRGQPHPL